MPGPGGGAAAAAAAVAAGKEFLLEQELPGFDVAVQRAKESLRRSSSSGGGGGNNTCRGIEQQQQQPLSHPCDACACPHLRSILPSAIDLTLIQSSTNCTKWMVKDPVAALHMHSQLESAAAAAAAAAVGNSGIGSNSNSGGCITTAAAAVAEPVLYGEEQERWMAACTPGFPDTWHPWIHEIPETTAAAAAESPHNNSASYTHGNSSSNRPTTLSSSPMTDATTTTTSAAWTHTTTTNTNNTTEPPPSALGAPLLHPTTTTAAAPADVPTTTTTTTTSHGSDTDAVIASSLAAAALFAPQSSENPSTAAAAAADTTFSAEASADVLSAAAAVLSVASSALTAATVVVPSSPSAVATAAAAASLLVDSGGTTTAITIPSSVPSEAAAAAAAASLSFTSTKMAMMGAPVSLPQQHLLLLPPPPKRTYMSLNAFEDQIAQVRRNFLSKRSKKKPDQLTNNINTSNSNNNTSKAGAAAAATTAAAAAAAAATKKRKGAEHHHHHHHQPYVPTLQQMPAWKQHVLQQQQQRQQQEQQKDGTASSSSSSNKMSPLQELQWQEQQKHAVATVEVLMENFRQSRQCYWREKKEEQAASLKSQQHQQKAKTQLRSELSPTAVFGSMVEPPPPLSVFLRNTESSSDGGNAAASGSPLRRSCQLCPRSGTNSDNDPMRAVWSFSEQQQNECALHRGDDLMQCLECSFTGCAPRSACGSSSTKEFSKQHIIQHFLTSNHKYAVTCGPQAMVYCFQCGDFVHHEIFAQEKERIDLTETMPWLAWKEHPVQRSFDALQFVHIRDLGIFWRGMQATYPVLVPLEHIRAARLCRERQVVFQGEIDELPLLASRQAIEVTVRQHLAAPADRWRVPAPVGMYNLGNTCFMSAILHCLVHCVPLQRYFIRDIGHNHASCAVYRAMSASAPAGNGAPNDSVNSRTKTESVCLACEMDKLFLRYLGSAVGLDVLSAVNSVSPRSEKEAENGLSAKKEGPLIKGDPLITADMLTAAWKCGGLNHLAGYQQRDAHEFLHGFLEILGKHMRQYRVRMYAAVNTARPANCFLDINDKVQHDEIKNLVEGTLRSVLVCRECGSKRIQSEPFMSISLPLSKEVQKATSDVEGSPNAKENLSVERCLRHFTLPEMLADPVDCPNCGRKTPTKKQHVVSKLPKVLCLHLKRFDAAQNKKIEDFVSFPSKGLNMGPYLPHWCEVSRVPSAMEDAVDEQAMPQISYDLFSTVNHFGNLQSGHYVTNVKVKNRWFHCNDSHIGYASIGDGDGEAEVLRSEGAYLLFYVRR